MANDPYSACVCGSGKKLKFCCQDILGEMQRIEQLRDNQPAVAAQHLRALYESHPDKDVLVIELAGLVQESGEHDEARELCINFLRRHPDEIRVILRLSELMLQSAGFDGARRLVHRAIQLAQADQYGSIAMLLASISDELLRTGNAASAYAHLRRAIQFAPDDLQSSLMMLLSSWTARVSVYFPLLGSLELIPVDVGDEYRETEQKAQRLSDLGCWEPSAILYSRLVKQEPDNGALWYNLGLFYLWDDRRAQAADALHKAASLLKNFDIAVEAETLAVLLDVEVSDDRICTVESSQKIRRPRELSARLQESSHFRLATPESQLHSTQTSQDRLHILADAQCAEDGGQEELGSVSITANIDDDPDQHLVTVTAVEPLFEQAWSRVRTEAGDSIEESQEPEERAVVGSFPSCCAELVWNVCFDPSLPAKQLRSAIDNRITASVELWLQKPVSQLNNLSPLQAAEDPELKIQTAAAVLVLYSFAQRLNREIRIGDLRERLNIPNPAVQVIDAGQALESVPLLRYCQLSLSDLTDGQLLQLANRVGLIHGVELLEQVVEELFERPQVVEEYTPRRAHMMRAVVARFRNRMDDMAESFDAARKAVLHDSDQFQSRLDLDLKELTFRLDDPEDPGIPHLLRSMRDQYFRKVPEIAETIRQQLAQSGCEKYLTELESPMIVGAGMEAPAPASSSGKLWLPGQD